MKMRIRALVGFCWFFKFRGSYLQYGNLNAINKIINGIKYNWKEEGVYFMIHLYLMTG